MLAISADAPADSAAFAHSYGIAYPLLSDSDGKVASLYAGVTSDRAALPGVVIISRDGRVVFRKLGEAKDDRMSSSELLAAIDRSLGTSGPAGAARGYAPIDRAQLRLTAGGGVVQSASMLGTVTGELAALVPLGRHFLVGPSLGYEPRDAQLAVDATLIVRAPIWADLGALQLGVAGGWTAVTDVEAAWNVGARAGLWFAVSPSLSVELGAAVTVHGSDERSAVITLGVARLFRLD